jgi:hypothetical protein
MQAADTPAVTIDVVVCCCGKEYPLAAAQQLETIQSTHDGRLCLAVTQPCRFKRSGRCQLCCLLWIVVKQRCRLPLCDYCTNFILKCQPTVLALEASLTEFKVRRIIVTLPAMMREVEQENRRIRLRLDALEQRQRNLAEVLRRIDTTADDHSSGDGSGDGSCESGELA